MTRHFYSDPYSAAYMAKNYGMRFNNGDGERDIAGDIDDGISNEYDLDPASVAMLQPCEGDIMECTRELDKHGEIIHLSWACRFTRDQFARCSEELQVNDRSLLDDDNEYKTIYRGGKSFIWPEQA